MDIRVKILGLVVDKAFVFAATTSIVTGAISALSRSLGS